VISNDVDELYSVIMNDVNVAIKPIREQARKTKTPRKRFLQGGV
jgi:hypothetical protein